MAASSSRTSASTRIASSVAAVAVIAASIALAAHGQALALAGIHGYQRTLSPVAHALGVRCRFTPTCSRYAEIVIARDGAVRGGWKTLRRIARCGPWTPYGTADAP